MTEEESANVSASGIVSHKTKQRDIVTYVTKKTIREWNALLSSMEWKALHDIPSVGLLAALGTGTVQVETASRDSRERQLTEERDELRLQVERLKTMLRMERQASAKEGQKTDQLKAEMEAFKEEITQQKEKLKELAAILLAREEPCSVTRERFRNLVAAWKSSRGHSSKTEELVMHTTYQRIIGMGEDAVPLLLTEMRERPDHWDWALTAITGCDPVPETAWGKLREIATAWVYWGKEQGYIK